MLMLPLILLAAFCLGAILAWAVGTKRAAILLAISLAAIGMVALTSSNEARSVFLLVGPFVIPYVVGATALGLVAGTLLKAKRFLLGTLFLLPPLLLLGRTHSNEATQEQVKRQGLDFVTSEKHLVKLLGQPVQADLVVSTMSHGAIHRLEYGFSGHTSLYAIIDVLPDQSPPAYRLARVTSVYFGHREVGKDDCAQGPVALPEIP